MQGKCPRDKIMLACRRVGSKVLTALAWADKATVFGVTDSPSCRTRCSGKVVQVNVHYLIRTDKVVYLVVIKSNIIYLISACG